SSEKNKPYFKVLKANKQFEWGEEQSLAFQQLKENLCKASTFARLVNPCSYSCFLVGSQCGATEGGRQVLGGVPRDGLSAGGS
ncbi:Gag-Pol polyprotein, partial [Bienertia sinuspersici]